MLSRLYLYLTYSFSYDWCGWPDSNRHASRREILSLLCIPFHHTRNLLFGVPPGTRTPTNSFGDCDAAITLGIHIWRDIGVSIPLPQQ